MKEELKVTSPEEYAQIQKRRAVDRGELVPLPSGMVVRATRADLEGVALKGGLPMSLARIAQKADASNEDKELTAEDVEEGNRALIFMRELTRKNCIEPRIVYDETGEVMWEWRCSEPAFLGEPRVIRREIETEDFKALAAWIRGEEVDDLDAFPNRKTRRARDSKSGRKALRSAPQPHAWMEPEPAQS